MKNEKPCALAPSSSSLPFRPDKVGAMKIFNPTDRSANCDF